MSNVIQRKVIFRSSFNDNWKKLHICVEMFYGEEKKFESKNESHRSEDEALSNLTAIFAREFTSENLRRKIIQEFRQMRGNDFGNDIVRNSSYGTRRST